VRNDEDALSSFGHFPELLVLVRLPWTFGIACAEDHFTTAGTKADEDGRIPPLN
jgi:hypothetical protein